MEASLGHSRNQSTHTIDRSIHSNYSTHSTHSTHSNVEGDEDSVHYNDASGLEALGNILSILSDKFTSEDTMIININEILAAYNKCATAFEIPPIPLIVNKILSRPASINCNILANYHNPPAFPEEKYTIISTLTKDFATISDEALQRSLIYIESVRCGSDNLPSDPKYIELQNAITYELACRRYN